jgi:hypothetical protein
MTEKRTLRRRIALRLATHAATILPGHRRDWARAISSETEHILSDRAALSWVIGCLLASYSERMSVMITMNSQISRVVLGLEMLICFISTTLLFLAVVSTLAIGRMSPADGLLYLSGVAVGPIGLFIAFRMIVLKRPTLSPTATAALCISAAWTFSMYSLLVLGGEGFIDDWWRNAVLIAFLPVVGAAHLVYLGRQSEYRPMSAL